MSEEKRVTCPFHPVCSSPSKSLDWACGEGKMENRCVNYHILKNRVINS